MTPTLTSTHYTIKGKRFVRVSEILRATGASDFSAIPERDREFYLERGTANHFLWEQVERKRDHLFTFDERVEAYRAGHAEFLRATGFRALPGGIERRVCATWAQLELAKGGRGDDGVAGTMDRIGTIQNRLVLIDYKTSSVSDATRLQTALYLLMTEYKFGDVERYGVAIKNDGTYKMSEKYKFSDKDEALRLVKKFHQGDLHDR